MSTRSNWTPFNTPPCMVLATFDRKVLTLVFNTSAASRFNGSSGFGSWKTVQMRIDRTHSKRFTEKRNPMPRITDRIVKTGFQSSLKTNERWIAGRWLIEYIPKNVQTNIAFEIDIGMVNLLIAFHFRCCMRIFWFNGKWKSKTATFIKALNSPEMNENVPFDFNFTSSGVIVSVKWRRSSLFGCSTLHVGGNVPISLKSKFHEEFISLWWNNKRNNLWSRVESQLMFFVSQHRLLVPHQAEDS